MVLERVNVTREPRIVWKSNAPTGSRLCHTGEYGTWRRRGKEGSSLADKRLERRKNLGLATAWPRTIRAGACQYSWTEDTPACYGLLNTLLAVDCMPNRDRSLAADVPMVVKNLKERVVQDSLLGRPFLLRSV